MENKNMWKFMSVLASVGIMLTGCEPAARQNRMLRQENGIAVYNVQLRPEVYQGVIQDGDKLKLMDNAIVQQNPDLIVVEAEDALRYKFQPYIGVMKAGRSVNKGGIVQEYARDLYQYEPQKSKDASNGAYIDYTSFASFSITVTVPGKYVVWARHWLPHHGYWCYFHQLDGLSSKRINMPAKKKDIKKWFWKKCFTFELSKGTHAFCITGLHNGKRLDKLVFARKPDFIPSGLGPAAAPKQALDHGWVEFSTLTPCGLRQWAGLERVVKLNRGQVRFDLSIDGKTWQPLPVDNRIAPHLRAKPALRFRARLVRKPGKPSPVLLRPRASFAVDTGAFAVLQNRYYRLVFDRKTGSIVRMTNMKTGAEITDPCLPVKVIAIQVRNKGEPGKWLDMDAARIESVDVAAKRVDAVYSFLSGRIIARCSVELLPGMESRWSVALENNSDIDVVQVRYPRFERVALDRDSNDDVLLWPNLGGLFYAVPARGETRHGGYPGHLGSGFVDLFDETGGFSVALDDKFVVASFLKVKPGLSQQCVNIDWTKGHRVRAHGGKQVYRFLVGIHPGDWHDAALCYRRSFFRKFPRPDYPEWMIESDGWVEGGADVTNGRGNYWYDKIRKLWLGSLEFGNSYTQVWGSTFSGSCPTYYLPRKECGGAGVFARMNKEFRDAGGHIGYYFHGNSISGVWTLWNKYFKTPWSEYPPAVRPPDWGWFVRNAYYPDAKTKFRKDKFLASIRRWESGKTPAGSSGLDSYGKMSYHQGGFVKYLTDWTDRYVLQYHANVIYYDTMAWGADAQEFNPYGDYNGEGDIAMYKMKFLSGNIKRLRRQDPEYGQLTEGCGDLWNIYCGSLLSGFTARSGTPDVIRYTFPELIFFEGNANGRWGIKSHKTSLSAALLMGNKFDCIVRSDFSDALFALRQLASPLLARARFMSKIGIELTDARVQVRGHRVDYKGARAILLTFWNQERLTGVKATVDLTHYAKAKEFRLLALDRDPVLLKVERKGTMVSFPVSTAVNSIVVGVEKMTNDRAIAVSTRYDGRDVVLRVCNYAEREIPVTFRVAAKGVRFKRAEVTRNLPAGYHVIRLRPLNADALNLRQICTVDVSWPGKSRRFMTWVGPIVDDGGFEFYHDFGAVASEAFVGKNSRLVGAAPKPFKPAFSPLDRKLQKAGYVRMTFKTWPRYQYQVSFAARGKPGLAFMNFTPKYSDHPGRVHLRKVRTDRGWDIYEARFAGHGVGSLIIKAKKGGYVLVDDVRAVVTGDAKQR